MRHRFLAILLTACTVVLPYHAHALDCQNATREDARAICRDTALRTAEERRQSLQARLSSAMPGEERAAFDAYENTWLAGRNARCPSRGGEIDRSCLRQVIEDRIAELETLDARNGGTMSRLRFRSRRGIEGNPNVDIHATYVEFEPARGQAERLFNEQVTQLVNRLPFAQLVDFRTTQTWQDTIDIRSVYLSSRLLSATFSQWVCCGAHGSGGSYTINVDAVAGTLLVPERWFRLDEVAAACWYQFVESERGGESFRQIYPLREAIDRFSEALRRPAVWVFSRRGVELQFFSLMGFAAGTYTCRLAYADLGKTALADVHLPP